MDNNLREVLEPIAIMGTFGLATYFFVKVMTDYILKKKMIEKGFVSPETQSIFNTPQNSNRYSSLKWGLIVLFGGISLIIMEYVPFSHESPLPYGIFAVSVSIGFLLYFLIIKREAQG